MARLTILTPDLITAIAAKVAEGVPLTSAAELAHVSGATARTWFEQGTGTRKSQPATPLTTAFTEAIIRARAADEQRRLDAISRAGNGGAVVYRKVMKFPDGREAVEERLQEPQWQAHSWILERTRYKQYGRKDRLDVSMQVQAVAAKLAADMGLTVEEVLAEAQSLLQTTATSGDSEV